MEKTDTLSLVTVTAKAKAEHGPDGIPVSCTQPCRRIPAPSWLSFASTWEVKQSLKTPQIMK